MGQEATPDAFIEEMTMPVRPDQVPLDTAKAWAKRLSRTIKHEAPTTPWTLAKSQRAVAQMLGFDHWHALEKTLGHPAIAPPATLFSSSDNSSVQQWTQDLLELFYQKEVDQVMMEVRPKRGQMKILVRPRYTNRNLEYTTLDLSDPSARNALLALLPAKDVDQILDGTCPKEFLETTSLLEGPDGRRATCFRLPSYPSSCDISILTPALRPAMSLSELSLPGPVEAALRSILSRQVGAFFCTGNAGSGKTTLMGAAALLKADLPVIWGNRIVSTKHKVALIDHEDRRVDIPSEVRLEYHRKDKYRPKVLACMRADCNAIAMDDLRTTEMVECMLRATESGHTTLATLVSSGNLLDRLEDFGPINKWLRPEGLNGWATCSLIPTLCHKCSVPTGSQERKNGPGCTSCHDCGHQGRQLVVDLWEVEFGKPKKLFSRQEQARELVHQGVISLVDAEYTLGPLA